MQKEIFHYDFHENFYLGSEFIEIIDGIESMPNAATDVPPPPKECWGEHRIPVFNMTEKNWHLRENNFWHPQMVELCFHSGRDSNGPAYVAADRNAVSYHNDLVQYVSRLPMCSIPRIGTLPNFVHLSQRIDFLNECIEELEADWLRTKIGGFPLAGKGANFYHYRVETFVAAVRRFLDDLTMAAFFRKFHEYEPWKRNLPIDGYSVLLNKPMRNFRNFFIDGEIGKKSDELCEGFFELILGKNRCFLITIQGLNNTYKHSVTANLVRNSYGLDFPSVLSVGVGDYLNRNIGELKYHNHGLRQLMLGLNDYLDDLISRWEGGPTVGESERCLAHCLREFLVT